MCSYLPSFALLPRKRRKCEEEEDAIEEDAVIEEEIEKEEEKRVEIRERKRWRTIRTKTQNDLERKLQKSLTQVHETCFYFYAMCVEKKGFQSQLINLLKTLVTRAAVDSCRWEFLSAFEELDLHQIENTRVSDSEIYIEYSASAMACLLSSSRTPTADGYDDLDDRNTNAREADFRLCFCIKRSNHRSDGDDGNGGDSSGSNGSSKGSNDSGELAKNVDVTVYWTPNDEVASITRGRSPSSRLIYEVASGKMRLLRRRQKIPATISKKFRESFQSSVESAVKKLNMAQCTSKKVTTMASLAFHAADATKVEIFPPAPIKFIRGSLKKMQTNFHTFTFISLFSGCGVSARGLSDAGGLCVLFAEKDSYRREILKKNNPHLEAWQFVEKVEDINQDLIDRVVAKYKHVDLIEGGVRCDDVSSKNFKRGEKSFEEVAWPFLLVGKIETMVERAHMKAYEEIMKKTRKSRLQASIPIPTPCVVLIENVTGLAKRVNNGMPYICFLFQMCVQKKMSFAVRTLNAHDAGLDHWYQFMCSSARLICSYDERASYEYYEQHHHLRIFKKPPLCTEAHK